MKTKWISRSGIGKTSWTWSAIILAWVAGLALYAALGSDTASRIACGAFSLLIGGVFLYGTWRNVNGKQA